MISFSFRSSLSQFFFPTPSSSSSSEHASSSLSCFVVIKRCLCQCLTEKLFMPRLSLSFVYRRKKKKTKMNGSISLKICMLPLVIVVSDKWNKIKKKGNLFRAPDIFQCYLFSWMKRKWTTAEIRDTWSPFMYPKTNNNFRVKWLLWFDAKAFSFSISFFLFSNRWSCNEKFWISFTLTRNGWHCFRFLFYDQQMVTHF